MHLILLAFPLTIVLVGVLCYKTYGREQKDQELNESATGGYHVYPAPHGWTTPRPCGPYGSPPNHGGFGLQPADYNQSCGQIKNASTIVTMKGAEFLQPSNSETIINLPPKTVDLSASSSTLKFTSEKTPIREHYSLVLSQRMFDRNVDAPSPSPHNNPSTQHVHLPSKIHEPQNPTLERLNESKVFENPSIAPFKSEFNKPDSSPPIIMGEKIYNVSPGTPKQELDEGNGPLYQDLIEKPSSAENHDPLPRYTSGDREIFEKFNQRISLKQDNSYIGRLGKNYQPPPTVPQQSQEHTREEYMRKKSHSITKFESKK